MRAIANFVLDLAVERRRPVTNLSINKIVFFLHTAHLINTRNPLVTAKIEAWQFGPVFRELYHCFKQYEERPIERKATKIDPATGKSVVCEASIDESTRKFLEEEVSKLLMFSPSDLVSWSHERGGPWDKVWNHESLSKASMRISDADILQWFSNSKRN